MNRPQGSLTPSSSAIGQPPLALIVAADVPLMIALHITTLLTLPGAARPAPRHPVGARAAASS